MGGAELPPAGGVWSGANSTRPCLRWNTRSCPQPNHRPLLYSSMQRGAGVKHTSGSGGGPYIASSRSFAALACGSVR